MSASLLTAALDYARRGRPVFPVRDKRPLTEHGHLDASANEATIREWWTRWPGAGIATPTGAGWFVLDVDDEQALKALIAEYGPLPPTRCVLTPRGGRHMHLRGENVRTWAGVPRAGLDIRGVGGYVVIPPTEGYEWRDEDEQVAPAPGWLLELLDSDKHRNGRAPAVEGDIPAQQRNSTLTSMAGTMRRRGFSEAAITAALLTENRDRCKPPLGEREVRGIARSVARYKPDDDAVASLGELNTLLGLADVGKHIDVVRIYGRGSNAPAHILLDSGERIVLDPLGKFSTINKLSAELALQAGAAPILKAPDVVRILVLFHKLADHHENVEVEDRAWDLGVEYLRTAVIAEVVMDDQASRWQAFTTLERSTRTDLVLTDTTTGLRYVRTGWFEGYVRAQTGGPPEAVSRAMCALGWTRRGSNGLIKATSVTTPKRTLSWKFFCVPKDWEK